MTVVYSPECSQRVWWVFRHIRSGRALVKSFKKISHLHFRYYHSLCPDPKALQLTGLASSPPPPLHPGHMTSLVSQQHFLPRRRLVCASSLGGSDIAHVLFIADASSFALLKEVGSDQST